VLIAANGRLFDNPVYGTTPMRARPVEVITSASEAQLAGIPSGGSLHRRKEQEVMQQNNFDVSWTKIGESARDLVDGGGACGISYPSEKSKKMFDMDDDSDNDSRYASPKDFASKAMAADATNPNLNIYNSIEDVRTKETNKDHQYEVVKMPTEKEGSGSEFSIFFEWFFIVFHVSNYMPLPYSMF
jgi:hypothetical protein